MLAGALAAEGDFEGARAQYARLVAESRAAKDESGQAFAQSRLAGTLVLMGRLPEALAAIDASVAFYDRVGVDFNQAFNLPRQAEILSRLGESERASQVLARLLEAIAEGREAFVRRVPNVFLSDGLFALTIGDAHRARRSAAQAVAAFGASASASALNARLLLASADAALGRQVEARRLVGEVLDAGRDMKDERIVSALREEAALVLLAAGDREAGHALADAALARAESLPDGEAAWRLHCAAAGHTAGVEADDHRAAARRWRETIRDGWAGHWTTYSGRADIRSLAARCGLDRSAASAAGG
jgi:tetratricopeptide (TPR) repeat protein